MVFSLNGADAGDGRPPVVVDALGVTVAVTGLEAAALTGFPSSTRQVDVYAAAADPLATITEFTRVVLDRTQLLCIHAGVVHSREGAIAFPGRSGLGKSTLTAALVRAGFGYLSDEVLAVQADGQVRSFPRPVALDATSRKLLHVAEGRDADEIAVPVSSLGSLGPLTASLANVTILERVSAGPTSIVPAKRSDAVACLIENSFNSWHDARASLALLFRLVSAAEVWRATYSDATDLACRLRRQLE